MSWIDTQGNGTNSSTSFISSEVDFYLLHTAGNSINIILGLPINSYVVWLILSGAGGTMASEFFYLNLAVSQIIASLTLAGLFTHNNILGIIAGFANFCFYNFSGPSFQCCICVERYIAVVQPVVFLRYKPLRYRVACCSLVWLIILALSSFCIWLSLDYINMISLGLDIVYISVVSFCCFSVLRALKQPGPGEGHDSGEGNNIKRRAFKMILISLVVMVVTILSHITNVLTTLLTDSIKVTNIITSKIVMMSWIVHSLLYIYKVGKLPCFKGF